MEVYVCNVITKSITPKTYICNLCATFDILRKFKMRLSLEKCSFDVSLGKFLGFVVSQKGIDANSMKVQAALELRSPYTIKVV